MFLYLFAVQKIDFSYKNYLNEVWHNFLREIECQETVGVLQCSKRKNAINAEEK